MKKQFKKGFTLIELLVVIAIIGILSSVVLASLNSARVKARDVKRIADLKQIRTALDMYYNDNNQEYPADLAALVTGNYMPATPADPLNSGNYIYQYTGISSDVSGAPCDSYHIGATLEDTGNAIFDSDIDNEGGGTVCTGGTGSDFDGGGVDYCGSSTATTDACYDLKP
ncbi:MAG: type II secretion system protein [Candidatus Paceibacter sp.]|nr:type II secretion system protein [Candidatus Paceibacter sp.]